MDKIFNEAVDHGSETGYSECPRGRKKRKKKKEEEEEQNIEALTNPANSLHTCLSAAPDG